jgi:hypothetical protein
MAGRTLTTAQMKCALSITDQTMTSTILECAAGTGKTTVAWWVQNHIAKVAGWALVSLATTLCAVQGSPPSTHGPAKTLHHFLRDEGWWTRIAETPRLSAVTILLDEAFVMQHVDFCTLLDVVTKIKRMASTAIRVQLVIVGDPNQTASVGVSFLAG